MKTTYPIIDADGHVLEKDTELHDFLEGRYRGAIHQSDLAYDSHYNTYLRPGLPPGPIANPGRASLEAAMAPAPTNYLYFVANGQSGHRFSATLKEHAGNVAAYRRSSR